LDLNLSKIIQIIKTFRPEINFPVVPDLVCREPGENGAAVVPDYLGRDGVLCVGDVARVCSLKHFGEMRFEKNASHRDQDLKTVRMSISSSHFLLETQFAALKCIKMNNLKIAQDAKNNFL
jgi:hypothetical protein